jgi:acetylornithine deacetylase/succinyl-diaminopimelate desuccinylase-like protein
MSKEDRAMIHGVDERIRVETLIETVKFYSNLLVEI